MLASIFRRSAAAVAKLPPQAKGRLIAGTALAALCCTTITGFEGLRTSAYRDSIGVPTICIGETKGVRMGMTVSKPQCEAMLLKRLTEDFAPAMERCVTRPMGDDTYAAFLSLSYNIGSGGFCKSSVVRLYNAGDRRAACHAILKFDRAGGRVVAGLVRRRKAEEALCLKGV
ncbi:lysozyme [Methylobacterium sp. UNC378MF]|uniref:lysozyme n=1 Tax=Methylobacterium sp. UNC378MF TaxID=1502748 RepID=UPI00088A1A23|nr:lysozyme [Methylobacterium sp. UNC378MF]SDA12829.1 lysozyme [Methylobacterium sp. UNC378MF]